MPTTGNGSAQTQVRRIAGTICDIRAVIRWSQRELSRRSGVLQSVISRIERAKQENLDLATVIALLEAMGARLRLAVDAPILGDRRRQADAAHARMSGQIARRLEAKGWHVASEAEIGNDRSRGWIDILAFHPVTRLLLVIEVKTQIHDLGQIDRTLGWYEREAWTVSGGYSRSVRLLCVASSIAPRRRHLVTGAAWRWSIRGRNGGPGSDRRPTMVDEHPLPTSITHISCG